MKRIIIVDDKEENLYYLDAMLSGNGYEVERAHHGVEALAIARQAIPDLVVSDLFMPVMDGYTLLRQWKADERLRDVPFLVYTATYADAHDESLARSLGADAFVLKPSEPDVFLGCIAALLESGGTPLSLVSGEPEGQDYQNLKVYNETLVRKLEEKTLELAQTNRRLEADLERRREVEAELRAREATMATAQRIAHVGSWVIDLADGVLNEDLVLCLSEEMRRIAGFPDTATEVTPAILLAAIPEEEHEKVRTSIESAVRDGQPCYFEHRFVHPDGRVRHVQVMAEVSPTEGSEHPLCIIGTTHDITERKRSENELRFLLQHLNEEHARLVAAQKVAKIGSWELDLATYEVIWSDEMHRIFGTDPDSFAPSYESVMALLHPEDRERVDRTVAQSIPARGVHVLEHRVVAGPGCLRHVAERWRIFEDEQGRPVRAIGTCHDVTERVLAEETNRRTAALLQGVAEGTSDAVFVKDVEGRYLFLNSATARFVGKSVEEVLGRDDRALFDAEGARQAMEADRRVMECGRAVTEEEVLTSDGVTRTYLATKAPYRDKEGRILGTIGISRDISEKKALESQILRSQRMESIGTLAGGIAHDLNNVLTPIMMSIGLLKSDLSDPGHLEILRAIETSAKRGSDLVRQVLSFARGVDAKKLEVRIAEALRDAKSCAEESFPKNIAVEFDCPGDLWMIEGDATQIHQVLHSLSLNARDAMESGGKLLLRAKNFVVDGPYAARNLDSHAGPYVCLEVEDTGTGMRPEVVERIFEPFFTTKELGRGTGLGLSTALAIVKSHGGFLRVESVLGEGTIFRLYFPAKCRGEGAAADSGSGCAIPSGCGERVLVIDEEETRREITRQTLENRGYKVVVASTGAEALSLFAKRKDEIDLVLSDMRMRSVDGASVLRVISRIDPGIPLVAAGGMETEAMEATAAAAGVRFFLPPSYTTEALLRTLREALDGAAVREGAASAGQ